MGKINNELDKFKTIPKELVFDTSLSDRARFVYVFMACKPETWEFYLEPMSKEIGYSVDTLRKYLGELVQSGWIEKGEQVKENGEFRAVKYTIKITKFSDTVNFRHGKTYTLNNSIPHTEYTNKNNDKEKEILKEKTDDDVFVDNIYAMYPAKCPVRNTSLGKCSKDKDRIRKLLKTYSKEDIEKVVAHEVDEKYGKSMMQNFSTFLNNFPDPKSLFGKNTGGSLAYPKSVDDVNFEDVMPTYDFYVAWLEKKCRNIVDNIRSGFPENNEQYKRLVEHTKGGARALAYVHLVLNRDGWDKYDDNRGLVWIYNNFIRANGLFQE